MSKVVLGKGLDALIPGDRGQQARQSRFRQVAIDKIAPNPMQPRRVFDDDALAELAGSIKQDGLMQPLVVRQNGSTYTIIAGERRFRAASMAGLTEVPVVVMEDVDDDRMLELALIENIQRADLNPLEVADAYQMLIDRCQLTQADLARRVGKSRSGVANILRLRNLPESVQAMLRDGRLTEGHARAVLAAGDEDAQVALADQILDGGLTVRRAEKAGTRKRRGRSLPRKKAPEITEVEAHLKRLLGTSVSIKHGLRRGKIEIEYYGAEDLDRILDLIRRIETF